MSISGDAVLAAVVAVLSLVLGYLLTRRTDALRELSAWQRSVDRALDERPTHAQQRERLAAVKADLQEATDREFSACKELCRTRCGELTRRIDEIVERLDRHATGERG